VQKRPRYCSTNYKPHTILVQDTYLIIGTNTCETNDDVLERYYLKVPKFPTECNMPLFGVEGIETISHSYENFFLFLLGAPWFEGIWSVNGHEEFNVHMDWRWSNGSNGVSSIQIILWLFVATNLVTPHFILNPTCIMWGFISFFSFLSLGSRVFTSVG